MSCKKAWGVLEEKKIDILTEINATKKTIGGDAIWELVRNADKVVVASGKKIVEFSPAVDSKEMLAKISGRTGNLRAPTVKIGNIYYVGFNQELYNETIG